MNIAHNRKEPSSRITAVVTGSFGPGMRQRILSQLLGVDNSARQLTCISPQRRQSIQDISFGQHRKSSDHFDSCTEIGVQSSGGGSARQARQRLMKTSDGRSKPPCQVAAASKSVIASDQFRSS